MSIIEVTSKEFRDKQKTYFELVDRGEKVIVRRGKGQSYLITPVESNDIQISPEMERKIALAVREANEEKATRISGRKALDDFLDAI